MEIRTFNNKNEIQFSVTSSSKTSQEIEKTTCNVVEYDIENDKHINYLFDYSLLLKEFNLIDKKIDGWQSENKELLRNMGIIVNQNSEISNSNKYSTKIDSESEFFKLTLSYGNYQIEEIIKNLETKRRKRKRDPNLRNGNLINLIQPEKESENLNKSLFTNKKRKLSDSQMNHNNEMHSNSNNINDDSVSLSLKNSEYEKNQSHNKHNINLLINNMTNDEEKFESIVKEFLNITNFPTESKEKLYLLKKLITIYKRVKDDREKLNNFFLILSNKINEPFDEIKVNILFLYFLGII